MTFMTKNYIYRDCFSQVFACPFLCSTHTPSPTPHARFFRYKRSVNRVNVVSFVLITSITYARINKRLARESRQKKKEEISHEETFNVIQLAKVTEVRMSLGDF